jgi:hypothetical protein
VKAAIYCYTKVAKTKSLVKKHCASMPLSVRHSHADIQPLMVTISASCLRKQHADTTPLRSSATRTAIYTDKENHTSANPIKACVYPASNTQEEMYYVVYVLQCCILQLWCESASPPPLQRHPTAHSARDAVLRPPHAGGRRAWPSCWQISCADTLRSTASYITQHSHHFEQN